jgi:hypothetical protein
VFAQKKLVAMTFVVTHVYIYIYIYIYIYSDIQI